MLRLRRAGKSWGRNLLAGLVAAAALGVAQINFDPVTIGSSPLARAAVLAPPMIRIEAPRPVQTASLESAAPAEADRLVPVPHQDPALLCGAWALRMTTALLEKGMNEFSRVSDYTAVMFKQERINGVLGEGQSIDLKVRHEPFSVYMKWLSGDRGRQCIYVDGQNDGNLLVQPGGVRGRLTGLLSLEPTGALALSESRHPITKAGLLNLAEEVLEFQHVDLNRSSGVRCEFHDNQNFENRPCYLCCKEYDSPEVNQTYRKVMIFIDKELSLPVCVRNYGWGRDIPPEKLDEETLIELYAYTDLKMLQQLSAVDFDQTNKNYKLRVKK